MITIVTKDMFLMKMYIYIYIFLFKFHFFKEENINIFLKKLSIRRYVSLKNNQSYRSSNESFDFEKYVYIYFSIQILLFSTTKHEYFCKAYQWAVKCVSILTKVITVRTKDMLCQEWIYVILFKFYFFKRNKHNFLWKPINGPLCLLR